MSSFKTLQICTNPTLGGLELYFYRASEYLHKHNCPVVAVTKGDTPLDEYHKSAGIKTYNITRKHNYFPLVAAYKLAKIIETEQIDLVHTHFKYDICLAVFARWFSKRKFKVVHTRHMAIPHSKKGLYHNYIYKSIDLFMCITEQQKKSVLKNTPVDPCKVHRLYYGVDEPSRNLNYQKEFFDKYPSSQRLKLGMFSRIGEGKGHHRTLNALSSLKSKGVEIQAYFVGLDMNDGYRKKCNAIIQKNKISDLVHWCGFTKNPIELMSGFDFIVLPSDVEAFGLVLVEAMRASVCVLGANSGGVPEIIDHGKNGYLFDIFSENEFSDQLLSLVNDPGLRSSFASAGKQKADKAFEAETHFQKLIDHYKSCYNKT